MASRAVRLVTCWLMLLINMMVRTDAQSSNPSIIAWGSATGGTLHIQWNLSTALDPDELEGYHVIVNNQERATVGPDASSYYLYGLSNNTVYSYQVKAILANGSEPLYSDVVAATTLNRTAPNSPDIPTKVTVSGGFVQVSVETPHDTGGVALSNVTVVVSDIYGVVTSQTLSVTSSGVLVFNSYGLNARTKYWISAFATNEGDLVSSNSDPLVITTTALQLPGPCPPPTVVKATGASVLLQLNPPLDDGGSRIQGYNVYIAADDISDFTEVTTTIDTDKIDAVEILYSSDSDDEPLLPNTRYFFKAVAVNLADICISVPISLQLTNGTEAWTTAASVPGAPPSPYFLKATGGMITMLLLKPTNMQGVNCTGFSIKIGDAAGNYFENSVDADDDVMFNATSLQSNSSYAVFVAVITDLGTSLYSAPTIMNTTVPTAPSNPRDIAVTNVTESSALLEWSSPFDSGDAEITGYTIILMSPGRQEEISAISSPILIENLAANKMYTVKVTAANAAGKKSASTIGGSFSTLSLTPPGKPLDIALIFATGGAIEIAWNPSQNRGGELLSAIEYKTTAFRATPCFNSSISSPCSACNSVKLKDTQYQLIEDALLCQQPTTQCPDSTFNCCLTRHGSSHGFGLSCGLMTPVTGPRAVVGTTSAIFNGLNYSSTYYFSVQASNRAGKSTISELQGFQTTVQTSPSYPASLRQLGATGGSIQFTWDSPVDTGGGPVVGYRVYRNYELLTPRYVMPPYSDCSGMAAETTYVYGVAAVNASLVEGAMAVIKLSTEALSTPMAPTFSLIGSMYNRLQVSVTPPCDTGGEPSLSYQYMVKNAGTVVDSSSFNCCSFVLENLEPNQSYSVLVKVENSLAAPSTWAQAIFKTASGIPPTPVATLLQVNTYSAVIAIGSKPYDKDTRSYDVFLRRNGIEIQNYTVSCEEDAIFDHYVCPTSYKLEMLKATTEYEISAQANGPLGSSASNPVSFKTSDISPGAFGMADTNYNADKDGIINTVVRRSNGTSGAVEVGVHVTGPDTVFLRCKRATSGGCDCTLYLISSESVPLPCYLSFVDGQENASVAFSMWDDQSAELLPSQVVVSPFGVDLSGQHSAVLHMDARQEAGFVSFPASSSVIYEDSSFVMINVLRLNGTTGRVTFSFESFDITAVTGEDYVAVSGTIVLTDQQSSTQIWVQLIDNLVVNSDKVFGLRLTGQTELNGADQLLTHNVTIHDDESISSAVPRKTDNISIVYSTGGEFEIGWTSTASDGVNVTGYLVRVSNASLGTFYSVFNTTQTIFTLSGLSARSIYLVEVAVWNHFGVGEYSDAVEVATTDATLPSSPLSLSATDIFNTEVTLTWKPPRDDGGSPVVGYHLSVEDMDGNLLLSESINATTLLVVVDGLNASSYYDCYVSCSTESFPDSMDDTSTAQIRIKTAIGVAPSAPPAVTLVGQPRGGTLVFLMRRPSDKGGMPLSHCALYLRKTTDTASTTNEVFTIACSMDLSAFEDADPTCTSSNLLVSTSYEVYTVFSNAMGESPPGECAVFITNSVIALPSPPLNLRAPTITAGNIVLEWDEPDDLGGAAAVIGYIVYQKYDVWNDDYFTLYDGQDSRDRSLTARGLTRNLTYFFAVVALNDASFCVDPDQHNMSSFLEVSTLTSSPLAPPGLVYRISATGGAITIGWTVPDDLAGLELQGYYVELVTTISSSGFELLSSFPPGVSSFTHYGLSESASYSYAVTATNQEGSSERSMILTTSTSIASRPTWVQSFRSVNNTGGSITLTWDPPQDTGGRQIEHYEITRTGRSTSYVATSTTFEDRSGLSASSGYTYTIAAFNGLYSGYATSANAVTGLPVISDPPVFESVASFGGRLEVSWVAPEFTGGISVTEYVITLFIGDESAAVESITTTALSCTFMNLTASTPYVLSGQAVNDQGESLLVKFTVETASPDDPDAPPIPEASNTRGGSVEIHVAMPNYTGGEEVTLILYQDDTRVYTFVNEWGVTIYGLVAETVYTFKVSAKNSAGENKSESLPVTTTAISTPGQVQNLQKVSVTFSRMTLTWDTVQDTGGDEHIQYEVTFFKCDSTGVLEEDPQMKMTDSTRIVLEDLQHSSFYSISVVAITSTSLVGDVSSSVLVGTEQPFEGIIVAASSEMAVKEDAGIVYVPITRVNGSFGNVSYSFDVVAGSALDGVNYVRATGTRTLMANVVSDSVDISVISDTVYNPGITFQVVITDSTTALQSTTDVYLEDDGDAGFVSFADPALMVLENSGTAYLTMTRTGGCSPGAVIETFVSSNYSVVNRFQLVDVTVVFEENVTQQTISVSIADDSEFQYVADSITIGFHIVEGGVLNGTYTTAAVTALDDGDISLPKQCLNLQKILVSGGALGLQWTPPVDRGGADITLSYLVSVVAGTGIVITKESPTETITLYGLNQSTTYQLSVQAVNSAGAGVSSTSLLIATRPATAPTAPRNIQVVSASSSSVLIKWDSPLDDGGSPIVAYKIYKVQETTTSTRSLFSSVSCSTPTVCTIKQLLALTSYSIQIQASTAFVTQGEFSEVVALTTSNPDYPDMPPVAAVTWASAGAMTVAMFDPVNVGGSIIQEYRLFMRADDEVEFAPVYSGASAEHTAYRLSYQTVYHITYQVVNSVGPSAYSPVISNQTLPKSLPSAPTNVSVIDKTGGAITLAWNEPLDVGGREVTGYTIKIASIGSNATNVIGYDGKGILAREGTVYGLAANTDYSMQVVAYLDVSSCFDSALQAWSSVVQASTTTATPPRTAPELLVGHYTGGIIELVWIPPKDKGGVPLTGYTLYLNSKELSSVIFSTNNASVLSFVHNDLTASTKYTYAIKTSNAAGDSPLSLPLMATTDMITFPSAPLNVRQLTYTTGGAITIGWDRSFDTGGQPIAGYMVYRNGDLVSGTLSADTRSFTNKDRLTANTSYSYNVRAIAQNLMVSVSSEDCSAKTTAATKPQKPQSLSAVPGSSFLNASWIPDGDSGGLPITSYGLKLMLGSLLVENVTVKTASYYLFTGLTASTSYSGYVKVNNDIGTSEEVSATLTTTSVSVPNSPNKPLVTSVYGGNFTIQVEPPLFTGGSPVTDMKIYEYILDVAKLKTTLKVVPGRPTSYTFYNVTASSKYPVACSAVNSVGEGLLSDTVTIQTTPQNQPGPILTAPVPIGATGTALSISWSPPADTGGSLDLSYEVRIVNSSTDATNPTINLTYTATQLAYSSVYSFSVCAVNKNGHGIWSPARTITTQPDAAGEFNFAQSSMSVLENATQVALVVQRTSGLSGRITVFYSTESTGTRPATIGSDYFVAKDSSITTGTIVFESLQSQNSIVILITNDADYENPDETFAVRFTGVESSLAEGRPKIGSNNVTTVTIVDDGDAGFVSFEKPAYAFSEDARTGTVTIIREYGKSTSITLGFDFWGGTASPDIDYSKTTTPVVMDSGVTKANFTFSIINDKLFEFPDEYFFIRMTVSGGARLHQPVTRITILDDGDISDPGTCPPPQLLSVTGGLATFATDFPDHNGSATGAITNYMVRLSTETSSMDFTKAVAPTFSIGNLTAMTSYNVTIAATNSFGLGTFSNSTQFSTIAPSLPGASTLVSIESRTGGRISLAWSPPEDSGGVPIAKYRVYIVGKSDVPQLAADYLQPTQRGTIYGLSASTAYNFSVQAGNAVGEKNGWGNLSASFRFYTTLATQPGPLILHSNAYKKATGGKVFLSWNAPLDTGGTMISSYSIFARSFSRPWFLSATASPNLGPLFAGVAALNASTAYEFFVLAASSVPSMILPGKFSIAEGSRTLRTSVDLSNRLSIGSVISIQDSVFVVDDMSNAISGTILLKYHHVMTSIMSQSGRIMGQATTFTTLNTSEPTLPDLPPAPVLSISTGGMINVTLLSPEDTGGIPILDFSLYWDGQKLNEDSYVKTTSKVNYLQVRTFVSVPKLKALTTYNVSAVALNSLSLCNFGRVTTGPSSLFTTIKVTAPGAPLLVTYRTTGGGITMSMIDPHDTGGSEIQQYQLYYKRNESADPWQLVYNGPKHQATIARLNNSSDYAFVASVYNGEFTSMNSSVKVVRTSKNSPPGSCEAARLVNATGGMLKVEWDYPADNGGSEVTDFYATIASHSDGSGRTTVKTNTTSCAFYRLLAESSYDVVIRANNSYGLGPESPIVTFSTTKATPPEGIIDVTVQMTTGGAAEISFSEPIDLGGAISSDMMYSIYLDQDNTLNVSYDSLEESSSFPIGTRRLSENIHRRLETSTTFSNIVVGDMDPDTLYGIQILPISKYASGGISSTFAVETTSASIPSAPVGLSRDFGTGGSVSLSWGPPVDSGGIPLNEYTLSMSNVSKDGPFTKVYEDFQATTMIYKLLPGTTYWAYVTAWNDVGESPQSEILTFTTRSVTAPSAPQNLRVVTVGPTSIDCAWEMPSDIGGDAIDVYTITVVTGDPPIVLTFTTRQTFASLTGLSASTSYSISMTAQNTFGDSSPPSLARYARTSSGANIPSTPQIGCVSRDSVELSWYPYPGATATYHVERAGVDIGTTTNSTFVDKTTLSTATSYRIWTTQSAVSEPVTVTTLDPSESILDAICQGRSGRIRELNYANKVNKEWRISPMSSYSYITLTFSTFELECDHDYVEILDAQTKERLWKGGCIRMGRFVYQAKSSVIIAFTSDASVTAKGFDLHYEIDGTTEITRIPLPGNGIACSGHGRRQSDGSCKCSVGFTGEGCNNRIVCCSDPTHCHHAVCDLDPDKVFVVSGEFGDDVQGTGQMMDTNERGTASKAVKTITRALQLSKPGSAILVYPGTYSGSLNRDLNVDSAVLTITTLKGPFWTNVDCGKASRFLFLSTSSKLSVEGLAFQNCVEADGGVFKIIDGEFTGTNLYIADSSATHNGGALYASGSTITLSQVAMAETSADAEGGALYLEDSNASMIESNVTKSTALHGGAVALKGTSSLSTTDTQLFENLGLESGGGIFVDGIVMLKDVYLANNEASSGGGLAMNSGALEMENCIIHNNKAEIGGGLALRGNSDLVTIGTSIQSNKATTGGGVYVSGTISIAFDKQVVSPSTIKWNTAMNGAGIYVYDSHASFHDITVGNGHANESAGGVAIVDSTVEWLNMIIQENEALEGGGLVLKNSQLTSKGPVLISENTAVNGGGIWMTASTMTGLVDTHCLRNKATENGGAIFVGGDATVKNVKQELNVAPNGGCVYAEKANISLENCVLTKCSADVAGGGMWMTDSHITVKNVILELGTAPDGGGVFAMTSSISGDMTIKVCTGLNHGGGMYLSGETLIAGVSVDNCDSIKGAAAYVVDADVIVENSVLSNSYASINGGGLYIATSTIELKDTSIVDDTSAMLGGGVYMEKSSIIHDGALIERCASNLGGGLYLNESKILAKTLFSSSQVSTNKASDAGGNLFLTELCSVEQLIISSGKAKSGGGMAIDSGSATIQGCSIVNNSAVSGGGMSVQTGSSCNLLNSVVSTNVANETGGGIGIENASVWHDNMSVLSNTARTGGGVFVKGMSTMLQLSNSSSQSIIRGNNANLSSGYGGGIYAAPSSQVEASGLALLDGKAYRGAGIYVDVAVFVLNDALFQNGNASDGGGIYASYVSNVELTNCSFIKNNASQTGGGVAMGSGVAKGDSNTLSMTNCSLTGNSAGTGGGIVLSLTNMKGANCLLKNNAAKCGGAFAAVSESSVQLINWEFINNTVVKYELGIQGGTLYITKGVVTISDSSLVSNEKATLALNGGLIYIENADTTLNVTNSLLEFGQAYTGGLIYTANAKVNIRNSTLHRGFGYDFGAGIFAVNALLDISGSIFLDNFAFYDGGAIYMTDGGQLSIDKSSFDLNEVQDRGGAIFLDPGATITATVFNSNFTRNKNVGFGSTIFIGRKNTAQLMGCILSGNGNDDTEGGTLAVVDAIVEIEDSFFEFNIASKGAAIQISRSANLTMRQTIIRNNSAIFQGGALHASIRAVATFTDCTIEGNIAGEGGGFYAMGSAVITVANSNLTANNANAFGGAISMRGSAELTCTGSFMTRNQAYTGGAVSIQENASFLITNSGFQDNIASDFGAGIFVDKSTEAKTQIMVCRSSQFGGNTAAAGADIFWVYYPWFMFECNACSKIRDPDTVLISTSAMTITPGWWPPSVTSGVSLGVDVKLDSNSSSGLAPTPITSTQNAAMNSSLTKPGSGVLWPTIVVRDYYGAIAIFDNVTRCRASLAVGEQGPFSFSPTTWVTVDAGYILFQDAEVLSKSRDYPYKLTVNCTLSPVLQTQITVDVTVDKCNPGYENVNGLCLSCEKGTYSLDGERCYLCPPGATCEQKDQRGTTTGVISPQRQQGYFVSKTRSTYAASSCDNPELWLDDDPCKSIDVPSLAARIHECASEKPDTFFKYWSRTRVYSCLSGNEYYACDTNAACVAATTTSMAPKVSISTAAVQPSSQCAVGYSGIMCATCADGYYKASSGTCRQCTDPKDPAVAQTTHMLAMLPIIVAVIALLFLCYLFSNAAEQRVVSHAQAAKRFQIYAGQSRARVLLLATKASIQRRVRSMIRAAAKRARFGRQDHPYLFQIEPSDVEIPSWRPEKFKIMLGFFQVIGSFKEVYEIPWPDTMSRLMDICSLADFNFVDATAAECLFRRDYFTNYRLALFALFGLLLLVFLVTFWGILRYRVKLSTLPRHCVSCGLPVFTLEHRSPPVLARRAELLAKLKVEQKMKRKNVEADTPSLIGRLKSTLRRSPKQTLENVESWRIVRLVMRALNWVDRITQLPASLSTHKPRCPTSQRIKNDVLDMVVHSNLRLWRARVWMRLYYKAYQNRCIKLFFWVLLLFYPMLCQRVIGTFYCDEVGDHYYLSLDRSNLCYEGTWLYYLPISSTLIIFWVFGVPLLFWVIIYMKRTRGVRDTLLLIQDPSQESLKQRLLLKMRLDIINHGQVVDEEKIQLFETEMLGRFLCDRNLNEPSTVAQVGFIYHSYCTRFWWFEVWDLGRKLLLNCIISLLAKAGANRVICGLVVLLVYLSVMLFYQPYREPSDSALAGLVHIQLFITLFCGLILKMGLLYLEERVIRLVTNAAIITNMMTLCYAVVSILNEKRNAIKFAQRQNREDHRRAITAHVRKLWRKALGYALTEIYLDNPDAGPMPLLVMAELARRRRYQQELDDLNAQLELTSAVKPSLAAHDQQDSLSASQINVLEDGNDAPDEHMDDRFEKNPDLTNNKKQM